MRYFRRSMTVAAASAAVFVGALASPASGATPQPPKELGNVKEWGMVAIKIDPNSRVAPATTKDVGGGSWTYGTEIVADGKRCYSYYFHGSKLHNATAKIANGSLKVGEVAGKTAKASRTAGAAYTCYAYWGVTD
ncbi:lactococcin 972 family bacteriocin [Streptomyces griseorubiginosus]|uniref:lactococcin 972 family bacteriocin n=1 Tax=Streptomyces griseorubiginosus TaxID=67304 RepID=UPI002E821BA4|nr:lactococcin 972 family bacteriocin [Streptomyces griseorubiginosus]WUB45659.1 lactococcin 972 family bacteriocin [Streptomyces griseorubiginosus]WUB54177.1 lactococcin 972 family bacteriocin [Streptomyces griseorubiginosus]